MALIDSNEKHEFGYLGLWLNRPCVMCIAIIAVLQDFVRSREKGVGSPSPNVVGSHNGGIAC